MTTHRRTLVLTLFLSAATWPCVQSSYYEETSSEEQFANRNRINGNFSGNGITPPVLNLATRANIFSNATCGEREPETYCKLVEHVYLARARTSQQCSVCDDQAGNGKRHPIKFAIDGSNRWWQSPSLQNGRQYEWVTITIDLKQVHQVAYIIIKAAISSRPGNWILERSLDGIVYMPWQYYAISDEECWTRYKIRAKPGKPQYDHDEEIICTSYYSSLYPLEGGEIHTSLVNGRPGADGPSERLTKFTMARFVRLRLQKIRTLHGDLMNVGGSERNGLDKSVMHSTILRRYFYSIKDISIGGHCVCFGHANECVFDKHVQSEICNCQHNTCGPQCDVCCPLFNNKPWGAGNSTARATCEACECHGQADACIFDPLIASQKLSINADGAMDGGGVCLDCKAHTTGINCERCEEGFFRPRGVMRNDARPCVKCQCDARGSDGSCVADDTAALLMGKEPGDCICKAGFTGKFCDQCEMGYRGFPNCNSCPCHFPGIVNMECEGDCVCKENVQGQLCTECKKGFYNLIKGNPTGCTQCFCHAVTDKCTSSNFAITRMMDHDNWFVTDLHGTKVIALSPTGGTYHIANEEFSSFSMYYWGNAKTFSGNRVLSYGLQMTFYTSWIQARGDTSGKPITEYDLIIQSTNNMLAFSNKFHDGNNATVHVTLNEIDCVVLPDIDNNIIQRNPTPALGTPCTRFDVMEGTHDVKRLLVRAKYHTDQIEGMLGYAYMEKADVNTIAGPGEKTATSVELCSCPPGYSGTSCQDCSYGYRKSNSDSWLNSCVKCDCNGHSPTCSFDGKCLSCEHNTKGERCSDCRTGFYGNANTESQFACKPCECPLAIDTNNFSPTCQMLGNSYECTACPAGYEGPFCERCGNGYYGNPTQPGDYCKRCDCNLDGNPSNEGNICDHLTGECLICPRNTIGWNCDECLPGHFGNPLNGTCSPCRCDETGSASITSCHPDTGQCPCKDAFTGRRCNECMKGHGNREEGCTSCGCNPIGSKSLDCDPESGQCHCKPGIGGRFCNKCLDLHFGFSNSGCLPCDCHPDGSDSALCDLNTGQCHCRPNVRGSKCSECSPGFWNIQCGTGCVRCDCDPVGSASSHCDSETGQCLCKPGVGGTKRCDRCLNNCYGFGENGCRPCDPCLTPGHVCDSHSGRCECPANVEGDLCTKCTVGYWGNPRYGCKPCNCSQQGASTPQCSPESGKCNCAPGFSGDKCDKCKFGYFNYPQCTPCSCDSHGTDDRFCNNDGLCSCADNGQCHCKDNVIGAKCDRCRDGTYGLEPENPDGCMECFCFHRTTKCSHGYFKWQRLALPSDRHVVPSANSEHQLRLVNNLIIIPDQANDIIIEKDISFSAPLYWQLPHIFLGDKVLSYNGFIRFKTDSIGGTTVFPSGVLASYPLVQIQRYPSLILEHYSTAFDPVGYHEVRLHEDEWRLKNGPYNGVVTKETMMVALQNLHHILLRGTHGPEVTNATLFNVSLDIAIPSTNIDKSMAHGIEVCECPPQYNSTSCQNPRIGFYRWYKRDYITSTVIIDLVGEARPCECNGRSNSCDTETGFCQNCLENTGGRHCEQCAVGYYGDPFEKCLPCPCPSIWNTHAESCYLPPNSEQFECFCRPGYTGAACDRCAYGYYGRPWETGGHCSACKHCNEHGSVSDECHEVTGQCNCKPGISGQTCSKCADRHVIVGKTCTSCDDQCTGTLLNELRDMALEIKDVHIDQQAVSAIKHLMNFDNTTKNLEAQVNNKIITRAFIDDIPTHETLSGLMLGRAREQEEQCGSSLVDAHATKRKGQDLVNRVELIRNEIRRQIHNYDQGKEQGPDLSVVEEEIATMVKTLNATSDIIEEISDMAEDELEAVNDLFDLVLVKVFNSTAVSLLQSKIMKVRENLEDLMQYISQADKNSDEAARMVILAREFLDTGRVNVDTIDDLTIEMEMTSVMTTTTLSDTGYTKTELEQVLLMLEDIMRDFRNRTKELEILETNLFELVPLFRVTYAQPAFDHVKGLEQQAQYVEGLLVQINGSEPFEAVTAYQRIKEGFDKAFELARDAEKYGSDATEKVEEVLSQHSGEVLLRYSADMIKEGLVLSGIVENSMRSNISACNSAIDSLKWRMKIANDSFNNMKIKIDELGESMNLDNLIERIDEVSDTVNEVGMTVMEMEDKIQRELKSRINSIGIGIGDDDTSSLDAVDASVQVNNAQHRLRELKSETSRAERLQKDSEQRMETTDDKMKYLKALIKQARHKANTVGVSIGPDETGTCFRLYKWPVVNGATSIKFNFAPTKFSDSLLFYWPSSITSDFISIEMVSGQIKASWDLGSGLRTLIHPKKLSDVSENSIDPDFWVQIQLERVGSFVTLDVKPITISDNSVFMVPLPSATSILYSNDDEEMTLMTLAADDLIHIGGMSKLMREGLVTNGLSGCIHNLRVNHQSIGLWNFVGNEGCAPCVECPNIDSEPNSGDLEYYFDGRGYSVVNRVQSKTFNSKFFDVSVEFRTLSENGLIFLTVNKTIGQMISLEITGGKLLLQVWHKWNDQASSLRIESGPNATYNDGNWVNVRAVWVYQKGMQIGKLMIGDKDFTQQKQSPPLSLDLLSAVYHIGGVSPIFDPTKWKELVSVVPYVGCMKNILINNSPYDPLSGTYYGVESPCGGKTVYKTSFEGDGFAEFGSKPMAKSFKFGFSFKTLSPTGLLVLSTNAKLNSVDDNYYAVYLENGQAKVQIGTPHGLVFLVANGTRYDDGKYHAIRFVKKNSRKVILFMDDEEIMESRLPKSVSVVTAPTNRGLFLGGTHPEIRTQYQDSALTVTRGFTGCIQNFYFDNQIMSFSFPISHRNHNLGQCPKHHEYDPVSIPTHFLYPNTMGSLGMNKYDTVSRVVEDSCSAHEHVIEQEDPISSLKFGDSPNSYVTLNLEGNKHLKQRFNLTFSFRTYYPNGLLFQGLRKKGNGQCLMAYLKDGQIIVKLYGERSQDLVSPLTSLNDGIWHQISLVKADDKMFLYVDNRDASQTQVPKIKAISKLNLGGIPPHGHDCLENSIHKPEQFKGCLQNFIINSHVINFETNHATLNEVNPCFRSVERGTFFRAGSFAIYTYNLTLGTTLELEMEYRSDSKNGLLLSFIPNKSSRFPTFSIFLDNGNVIARESTSVDDFYEATTDFEEGDSVCDGRWHSLQANYEKGSITLRVDGKSPIYAVAEPTRSSYNGNSVVGSLFIGGVEEGASRLTKKLQFHGCIRNMSVNQERKDWTDMPFLSQVYLNSCPAA
ncbi:laminin subunit alpha-1 isoform X2 [Folsomia candida]|uniref:laminin subunit alpha-1 isoform X2 n=1 Tax=Folsomia candida TaxID=158441 RepID=UPI001604A3A5|nr:laminin subunit alpha-1 isoform X2 [Folsomia candida]